MIFRCSAIPSFRIWGDFPSFRLLGLGGIFRCFAIPSFRIWGYFPPFRDSLIPSFRIWGDFPPFCDSVIPSFRIWGDFPLFHDSVILPFRLLGSPIKHVCEFREIKKQQTEQKKVDDFQFTTFAASFCLEGLH